MQRRRGSDVLAKIGEHIGNIAQDIGVVAVDALVEAAQEEATNRGVALETIHESCNRLAQVDGSFNVMTISQAIHWLDDVMLVKGVCRNLAESGSFFVVHGSLTVLPQHPLSYILGDKTPLGDKKVGTFSDAVRPLYKRISLLFDALDAPDVDRHDPHRNGGRRQ